MGECTKGGITHARAHAHACACTCAHAHACTCAGAVVGVVGGLRVCLLANRAERANYDTCLILSLLQVAGPGGKHRIQVSGAVMKQINMLTTARATLLVCFAMLSPARTHARAHRQCHCAYGRYVVSGAVSSSGGGGGGGGGSDNGNSSSEEEEEWNRHVQFSQVEQPDQLNS